MNTPKTDPAVLRTAYEFYRSIKKEPVILQKEVPGFISNRLQIALFREALNLIVSGVCTVEDMDKAVTFGPGLRWGVMGPLMIWQLASPHGFLHAWEHMKGSHEMWMEDFATWVKYPPGSLELAQEGIYNELGKRPPEIGNTVESLKKYRDKMLVQLLRLHGKI
jgi:3-hydroxyacyl-CoA dehydrogenase